MQEKEAVNDPICPTFLQLKRNSKSASRRLHRRGLEEGGSVNVWEAAISEIGSTSYKSKTVPTTDTLTDILGTTLNMSPYLFVSPSLFISLIHCLILCLSFLIYLSLSFYISVYMNLHHLLCQILMPIHQHLQLLSLTLSVYLSYSLSDSLSLLLCISLTGR